MPATDPASSIVSPTESNSGPTPRSEFIAGLKAISPVLLGVAPFAMISGIAAVQIGISPWLAMALSVIVYAGSAQLVAINLLQAHAPALVIILSGCVVNLRFLMYSASMAPYLKHLSDKWKYLLAAILTDQSYAVTVTHYTASASANMSEPDRPPPYTHWHFLGSSTGMWTTWQVGTILGILLGARIPPSWSLDFAVPLTFLALAIPTIKDRPTAAAALSASIVAVAAAALPYKLGLMLAALVGVTVGTIVEGRRVQSQ